MEYAFHHMQQPDGNAEAAIVFTGVVAPEALAAWEELAEDMPGLGLLNVTSPDLLHRGWSDSKAGRWTGQSAESCHAERLLSALAPSAGLVMVLDGSPGALSWLGGDVLHRFGRVDVSMAVAIDGGLITPVIKGVDALSLSAIALEAKELATKARGNKLAPEDYQGGTCSLSNLGMFGIDEMFPVINPPQALIARSCAAYVIVLGEVVGSLDHAVYDAVAADGLGYDPAASQAVMDMCRS